MIKTYLTKVNLLSTKIEEDLEYVYNIVDEFESNNIVNITKDIEGIYRYLNDLEYMY